MKHSLSLKQDSKSRLPKLLLLLDFRSLGWKNPEVLCLFSDFLPLAKLPSRKVLTQRLLPQVLDQQRSHVIHEAAGANVMGQCDGWSGENHHHYIAFMAAVNGKVCIVLALFNSLMQEFIQIQTVCVYDASKERKTAANLLKLIKEVIEILEHKWHVQVIAFVSDASGESRG